MAQRENNLVDKMLSLDSAIVDKLLENATTVTKLSTVEKKNCFLSCANKKEIISVFF